MILFSYDYYVLLLQVWDVSCGKSEGVIGGATIHLFNMKKQLKTGKHKLRLWSGKEADGSIHTTTPGKVSINLFPMSAAVFVNFLSWVNC